MKKNLIHAVLLLCCLAGCAHDNILKEDTAGSVWLSISLEAGSKSSAVADEDLLEDLNIWIYSSSGVLRDSHYLEDLSIHGSGNVRFRTEAGGQSRLVLIGNAGKSLAAPGDWSQKLSIPMETPRDGSGRILFIGEGGLGADADGFRSSVNMCRGMARIALSVGLSKSLMDEGAVLGREVRIASVRLCNSPQSYSFIPSSACNSLRTSKASADTPISDGDYLSTSDINTLHAGGTVYLYSLPNYNDIPYQSEPGIRTTYCSYVEMRFECDGLGGASPGNTLCRFYANDGARIGLLGGSSYGCHVTFSEDAASNVWRKEDYRFSVPEDMPAGTRAVVSLLGAGHHPDSISFSLSPAPGISSDGTFVLGDKVLSAGLCQGVEVVSERAGNGTLYAFDAKGNAMGQVAISASYPVLAVPDVEADVCGSLHDIVIGGLDRAYEGRASDELFESLYSVAGISSEGPEGELYPDPFVTVDIPTRRIHVSALYWTHGGVPYSWIDAVGRRFLYRVTLACGAQGLVGVRIVDKEVGRFASVRSYGEVLNTSAVPSPKSAVQALDGRNLVIERSVGALPDGLDEEWFMNGWSSWIGGDLTGGGYPADDCMSVLENGVRWNLGEAETQRLHAADIPVYIGKMNPWCGQYVRACVGTYSSTRYIPTGMEYAFLQFAFDPYGHPYNGLGPMEVYSMLVFREHDPKTKMDVGSAVEGDYLSSLAGGNIGLGSGHATWMEADKKCYVICYNGDYYDEFSPYIDYARHIESSSSFATTLAWQSESCSTPWNKYAATAYGGNGSYNRWIYLYCPYNSAGVYAADANGRVPAKGEVYVHLWSVSQKAVFDYRPSYDWNSGGDFIPPWR